jgi:hypothetical protein
MPSLRDVQLQFAHALFESVSVPADSAIYDDGTISPVARLAIYRNNLQLGFAKTLALEFPVLERLVGQDYFRQTAREFLHEFPSRSGDLHHIGRAFPAFLQRRFEGTEFAYLPISHGSSGRSRKSWWRPTRARSPAATWRRSIRVTTRNSRSRRNPHVGCCSRRSP